MFIPTIIIGLIGGLLGAVFTILHLKMTRGRKRLLANIQSEWLQKILRIFEPAVIIVRKLYEETNSNYCREITFIYKYNAFNFCSFYFICVCKFLVLNYGICVKIWKFWYIFMYLNKNVTVDAKMCFWEKKDNHACMPEVCIVRCPLFLDYSQHTIRVSASSFWLHQIHLYRGSQWGRQVWTFVIVVIL